MALSLPRFAVIQSLSLPENYLRYTSDQVGELHGLLQFTGEETVSPHSKFEIERATSDGLFVNIRSCYNNKYWVAQLLNSDSDSSSYIIVAGADKPHEDKSQLSCTLFELVPASTSSSSTNTTTNVRLRHIQLGRYLSLVPSSAHKRALFAVQSSSSSSASTNSDDELLDVFGIIDWESLVILPKHVAFKFATGWYLAAYLGEPRLLRFCTKDIGVPGVGNEVFNAKDGRVRLKNNHSGKFWRKNEQGWIVAESDDPTTEDTLFSPVKMGDNVIALRYVPNNNFCREFSQNSTFNCLNANATTISDQARLVVEEHVISRKIYNVRFRLSDARIYDENVITMVTQSAENITRYPHDTTLHFQSTDTRSSTWKSSISLKLGVTTSLTVGVQLPGITAEGKIQYSAEFTSAWEWGETVTTETQVSTDYTVPVKPMTKITVALLATRGTCDVPFSYTQRDTLHNGEEVISDLDDGLYTGVNSFNFHYDAKDEQL